jgi:SAM-dependent methyltransferase
VTAEDLPSCYPVTYFTHQPSAPAPSGTASPTDRTLRRNRDALRHAVMDAVRGVERRDAVGRAGRILSRSRRLRERAFFDHAVDELLPWSTGRARALDVGCGAGRLMLAMMAVGWEVLGVEWDPAAAATAERTTGRPVLTGGLWDERLPPGQHELIVLHHVFEHLAAPVASLGRIRQLLAPGGRAVLFFPNQRSLGAIKFRSAWFHWDPPRHLVIPPAVAVEAAGPGAGLVPIRRRTRAEGAAFYFACSREYRDGRPVTEILPVPTLFESMAGVVERALVFLGFNLGEEWVLVLRRD